MGVAGRLLALGLRWVFAGPPRRARAAAELRRLVVRTLLRGPGPWASLAAPGAGVPVPDRVVEVPRDEWSVTLPALGPFPAEAMHLPARHVYVIRGVAHGETGLAFHGPTLLRESGGIPYARDRLAAIHWTPREYRRLLEARVFLDADSGGPVHPVGRLLGRNYFHWLLESLPSILRVEEAVPGTTMLLPAGMPGFATDSLAALGVRTVVSDAYHGPGPVALIDPPMENWPHPEDLGILVRTIHERIEGAGAAAAPGRRVYVSRRRSRRPLAEEVVVEDRVRAAGFTVFHPSGTWADDVRGFLGADVIVGPHGAGLANAVLAAPGTRLVELSSPRFGNPLFRRMAAARGLDYVHAPLSSSEDAPDGRADEAIRALSDLGLLG